MDEIQHLCSCTGSLVGKGDKIPTVCPKCGRTIPAPKQFSDNMLEATLEIMAEEGAIWSGAR